MKREDCLHCSSISGKPCPDHDAPGSIAEVNYYQRQRDAKKRMVDGAAFPYRCGFHNIAHDGTCPMCSPPAGGPDNTGWAP